MPNQSLEERALKFAVSNVASSTTLAPGPGTNPSSPKAAIRRCCDAWQRAFDAYMADKEGDEYDKIFAAKPAREAYCNAMPMLAGYEGIRDFIACAAHGVLIGAVPKEKAGQLLYAAQVALATLRHEPKTGYSASS
jgi:hypothetical protein